MIILILRERKRERANYSKNIMSELKFKNFMFEYKLIIQMPIRFDMSMRATRMTLPNKL